MMMSEEVKRSTDIAGLPVVENAREVLIATYKRTLEVAEAELPHDTGYYKHVTAFTKYRLSVAERETTVTGIEQGIAHGQIEELIKEAEDELELLRYNLDLDPKDTPWGEPRKDPKDIKIFIAAHEDLQEPDSRPNQDRFGGYFDHVPGDDQERS